MDQTKMFKMSDLVKATGVSKQTIHFYLREGLLPPPMKTTRNMAYYGPEYVQKIALIKELQEKRYLPLSVIRLILESNEEGNTEVLQDHREAMEGLFKSPDSEESRILSQEELVQGTGMTVQFLEALEKTEMISPWLTLEGKQYEPEDVKIARMILRLVNFGLKLEDLSVFIRFAELVQEEAELLHDRIIHRPGSEPHPSLAVIRDTVGRLKLSLTKKIYRQMLTDHHHQEARGKEGDSND